MLAQRPPQALEPGFSAAQGDALSPTPGLPARHSLGLRMGREQCWSSQDSAVRCSSSRLLVDTIPLKDSNSGLMMTLNYTACGLKKRWSEEEVGGLLGTDKQLQTVATGPGQGRQPSHTPQRLYLTTPNSEQARGTTGTSPRSGMCPGAAEAHRAAGGNHLSAGDVCLSCQTPVCRLSTSSNLLSGGTRSTCPVTWAKTVSPGPGASAWC